MKKLLLSSLIISTLSLSGCTAAIFGGLAAAGVVTAATVHDRRTPGTVIDDRKLETVITNKLLQDKYIDSYSHTNLTIYNGVVLVTGEASSQEVIDRILSAVRNTANVKQVEHDLVMMPKSSLLSRSNDAAITSKVKTALLSLKLANFDPTLINVSTERGKVYLMGLVTRDEAFAITERARRVSGVKSITQLFEYIPSVTN